MILLKLSITPKKLNKGNMPVKLTINGKAESDAENPVHWSLSVDGANADVFIVDDDGKSVTAYEWDQALPKTKGNVSKALTLNIANTPAQATLCPLYLDSKTADGTSGPTQTTSISYS
jgi:hypothetical protein